jgi:hypothetical protein
MNAANVVTENKDNTLENYFFGLVMAKTVIYETIDSTLAKMRYLSAERGDRPNEIRWLTEEEKLAVARMLLGSGFDGNFDEIRKYVNRTFLENMETIRTIPYAERGAVPTLVLSIVENLIDVHDSDAMNFVMHDKKEDVESLLLERIVTAIKELGQSLLSVLAGVRQLFERTANGDHSVELAQMAVQLKRATDELVEKYEYDAEIENNIELFRLDMQRLRSRL